MYFCTKLISPNAQIMEIEQLYEVFKQHPIITTDSRECPEGSLFFALKGASFNGNQFAQKALEKGCARAVVDEAEYANDPRCILVDDCLKTLQQLARHHRRQFSIPVIGITGTNGKTTTTALLGQIMRDYYPEVYVVGNIGTPYTSVSARMSEKLRMETPHSR